MYQIVYVSAAINLFSASEISDLLQVARRNNNRDGLGGLLIYHQGCFMQVLEGEESTVKERFATIESDPRHNNCIQLFAGPVAERCFPDWSMGYAKPADVIADEAAFVTHLVTLRDNLEQIAGYDQRLTRIIRRFLSGFRELDSA